MVRSYKKKKDDTKIPNATGPKYRTPDFIKEKSFIGKRQPFKVSFSPGQFKTQHKG